MSTRKRRLATLAAAGMLVAPIMLPAAASAAPASPDQAGTVATSDDGVVFEPLWLANGRHTQYPNEGGTWEYGFWNAKVRSYYTVNRCHGSTVRMDDRESRSVNTASGQQSIAELWGVNYPGATDSYFYRVC